MVSTSIVADPPLHAELRRYGPDDCDICYAGFKAILAEGFPRDRLQQIDRQIRMATEPSFVVDQDLLAEYHAEILAQKSELLAKLGMTLEDKTGLMSNDALAALLMAHNVTPPTKVSKTTGKEMWAFAKTDEEFTDLENHPDPLVQAIVAARLGVKTTLEETRTARFISIGNLSWPPWCQPQSMPEGRPPAPELSLPPATPPPAVAEPQSRPVMPPPGPPRPQTRTTVPRQRFK